MTVLEFNMWTGLTFPRCPLGGARKTLHSDGGQNPQKSILWVLLKCV